jgi:hypothetical protein
MFHQSHHQLSVAILCCSSLVSFGFPQVALLVTRFLSGCIALVQFSTPKDLDFANFLLPNIFLDLCFVLLSSSSAFDFHPEGLDLGFSLAHQNWALAHWIA